MPRGKERRREGGGEGRSNGGIIEQSCK